MSLKGCAMRLALAVVLLALLVFLSSCGKIHPGYIEITVDHKYHQPEAVGSSNETLVEVYYFDQDGDWNEGGHYRVIGPDGNPRAIFEAVETGRTYCFEISRGFEIISLAPGRCE